MHPPFLGGRKCAPNAFVCCSDGAATANRLAWICLCELHAHAFRSWECALGNGVKHELETKSLYGSMTFFVSNRSRVTPRCASLRGCDLRQVPHMRVR
jgi:hypothetical protein